MQKKDYELIAKAIEPVWEMMNSDWGGATYPEWRCMLLLIERLGQAFAHDNRNFDRKKFRLACGQRYMEDERIQAAIKEYLDGKR